MKQLAVLLMWLTTTTAFAQQETKPAKAMPKETQWQYLKLTQWESIEKGEPLNDDRRAENYQLLLQQLADAEVK